MQPDSEVHMEDVFVDMRRVFKSVLKVWYKYVDWIYLAQDRDHFRAVMNMGMDLRIP